MKENTKIIMACVITSIITLTGSVVANTMLQANSISYKTSNGDTTDVNSALDRLFDINTVNQKIGNTDISNIGDGTITGAINGLNSNLALLNDYYSWEKNEIVVGKWIDGKPIYRKYYKFTTPLNGVNIFDATVPIDSLIDVVGVKKTLSGYVMGISNHNISHYSAGLYIAGSEIGDIVDLFVYYTKTTD